MTALTRLISLLLILIAATGSPAWCWPATHTLYAPADQTAHLASDFDQLGLPAFLVSRSTPIEPTWLARRMPLSAMLAGTTLACSTSEASPGPSLHPVTSAAPQAAATSLISLHIQLTV